MASKFEDDTSSSSSAVTEALQSPVILHEIFKKVDTKFLLSTCRMVSQLWYGEATSFLQNYRQCKVIQPEGSEPCEFLREFDNWLGQWAGGERKLPFNGLRIQPRPLGVRERCPVITASPALPWPNLKTHFNLKYLDGFRRRDTEVHCPTHHPFASLIQNYGEKLQILQIDTPHLLVPLMKDNPQLNLPHLKALSIGGMYISREFREEETEAVLKLLNAAPNLNQISAVELEQLTLIPEEKLPSLELDWPAGLNFRLEENEDIELLRVISERSPHVEQLSIHVPPFDGQSGPDLGYKKGAIEDEVVNVELRMSFNQACQQLLRNCHESLRTISMYGVMPLADLQFPPLPNVSKLEVTKRYEGELEQFWDSITNIEFDRILPRLQEVEICVHTGFFGIDPMKPRYYYSWFSANQTTDEDYWDADTDCEVLWPPKANNYSYVASTVNKLTLELQIRKINLAAIQAVFPNVSELCFHVPWMGGAGLKNVPLAQVWKYFPQLTKLEITGECRYIGPSLDADFCGITEEEAELLGKQTDEYLKLVHIVPIRPSVLTMPKMRDLYIDYEEFGAHDVDELDRNDRHYFITKVTRLVAFERMAPEVEVYIPSYMELGQESDDEEELEEEIDEENDDDEEVDSEDYGEVGAEDNQELGADDYGELDPEDYGEVDAEDYGEMDQEDYWEGDAENYSEHDDEDDEIMVYDDSEDDDVVVLN